MEVIAEATGQAFREKMLVTHRGVSGPAILQVSSYWQRGRPLTMDLAPDKRVMAAVIAAGTRNAAALRNAFVGILPKRFADRWVELHEPEDWTNASLEKLEKLIHAWTVVPSGSEGYEKAEVTAGGVDTDELSSRPWSAETFPVYFLSVKSWMLLATLAVSIFSGHGPPELRPGDRCELLPTEIDLPTHY